MSLTMLYTLFGFSMVPPFLLASHNPIGDYGGGSINGGNSGQDDLSTNGSRDLHKLHQNPAESATFL
jgi:hypothetical protein